MVMKSIIWTTIAVAGLVAVGSTPAYASSSQAPWYCGLPVIGQLLCPPSPGGGGGNSVPEPASLAILAAGAGMVGAAVRRRRMRK